jgi:hypothetical protein
MKIFLPCVALTKQALESFNNLLLSENKKTHPDNPTHSFGNDKIIEAFLKYNTIHSILLYCLAFKIIP